MTAARVVAARRGRDRGSGPDARRARARRRRPRTSSTPSSTATGCARLLADDPPQPVVAGLPQRDPAGRVAGRPARARPGRARPARLPLLERPRGRAGPPFAGVYGTKMIPGNQGDADARFRALADAIKFAFASAFSPSARAYQRAAGEPAGARADGRRRPGGRRRAPRRALLPGHLGRRALLQLLPRRPRAARGGRRRPGRRPRQDDRRRRALLVLLPRAPAHRPARRLRPRPRPDDAVRAAGR